MSKHNGVKNEQSKKDNPSQTRASTTVGRSERVARTEGE